MTQTIEQLQARVAELEADISEMRVDHMTLVEENHALREQLAAAQAEIKRLRDAIRGLSFGGDWDNGTHAKIYRPQLLKLLAQPSDTSALDSFVTEKVNELHSEIYCWQKATAENENKWIDACDQIATLTRQRDLAVEVLKQILVDDDKNDFLSFDLFNTCNETLTAIKEIENENQPE